MNLMASDRVSQSEYTLECVHVGLKKIIDRRLLFDSKLSVSEGVHFLTNDIALTLTRTLLRDKVLTDTQHVWFEKYVNAEVEVCERYWKWYFIPWKRWKKVTVRPLVQDYVPVDCNYYKTFPLADVPMPKEFGKSYKWMELKTNSLWEKNQDFEGDCHV